MTGDFDDPDDQGGVRLSHRLVALHAGSVALLIFVVLISVLWISAEHNRLALRSSQRLVESTIAAVRSRAFTLVRDYSVWDEGYAGVLADNRPWLYSNIGLSVTEIDTFDIALFIVPGGSPAFGWVDTSPPEGETGLLPQSIIDPILALLDGPGPRSSMTRTLIAEFNGAPWIFTVSRITPVSGPPEDVPTKALPIQIQGQEMTQERLSQIGESIQTEDLTLADAPSAKGANLPLTDFNGAVIRYAVWDPPRPGGQILRQVALPLTLALLVAMAISAVSSWYAVRSARRLERALFDAKAADRSKTEFLSNVSHELRTPMNGILGATQLLETTELDGEQRELMSVLHVSANAQMALISDLLEWTKLEGGNRRLIDEAFAPEAILKDVTDMMRVAAGRKKIGFEADRTALAGLTVSGDSRAFRQIVTNLLGNAIKFTEAGRVQLRTSVARTEGHCTVTVQVIDTGRGIPPEALARIFERFYQVDGSWTRASEGTGLGLTISRKLAEMTGGGIEVESEVGRGSTFRYRVGFRVLETSLGAQDAA